MLVKLFGEITPFLTRTTAIMTTVIILVVLLVFMVTTEREITRATVEKTITLVKQIVKWLIMLEVFLGILEIARQIVDKAL